MTPVFRPLWLAAALVLASCASQGPRTASPEQLLSMPRAKARAAYADPLRRSELRERVVDQLILLAGDPDPQVRANAVEAMTLIPSRAEPVIAAALRDPNLGVRTVAALAAGRLRLTTLIPALRTLRNDPSPFAQAAAIFALRRAGVDEDPTPLAGMLLADPSLRVRANAAMILGQLGDPSAIGLLRQAAWDPLTKADQAEARLLRLQIAEAMVRLGEDGQVEPVRAALYPSRPEELEAAALAVQIIGEVGDRAATNQLIYLAQQRNEAGQPMPAEIRLGVAGALAKLGKPEGSFVAEEFKASKNPVLRAQAAYVYGETGQIENLARLEALLSDPVPAVRVSAAGAVLRVTDGTAPGPARVASEH